MKLPSNRPGNMKVVFIKLIGGAKLTIVFFIACSAFLLLSLLEKPGEVIPPTGRQGSRHNRRTKVSPIYNPNWPLEGDNSSLATWNPSRFVNVFSTLPSCQSNGFLMIIVSSAPHNIDRRTAIRNTWGTLKKLKGPVDHQTFFVIGLPTDTRQHALLRNESQKYGDILFGKFVDSYRNLTLKIQYGLQWAWAECKPTYLLKTDDDCFVNVKLLSRFLKEKYRVPKNLYVGRTHEDVNVIRNPSSKWYVPQSAFHDAKFPPYASGSGYLLSVDVLEKIVKTARTVPLIPVEDAYFGILARASGVPLTDSGRFTLFSGKWRLCNYLYFMVVHDISPEKQYLCLKYSEECHEKCPDQETNLIDWE